MQAYKTSQGKWQVTFSEGGKPKTLYLGEAFTAGTADRIAKMVTDILAYRKRGENLPVELLRQVETLPERVRKSFERFGLASGSCGHCLLSELLSAFLSTKRHTAKTTIGGYELWGNYMFSFFGDRRVNMIQKSDCERFRSHCLSRFSEGYTGGGIVACRSILKYAVNAEWLLKNPFTGVSSKREVNLSRQFYVDRKTIYKVMEHCRDDHDRLALALARFGGLRIVSEIRHLRYSDFTSNVIQIHKDTKTGAREVPLFGEIREILDRIIKNLGKDNQPDALVFTETGGIWHRVSLVVEKSGVKRWSKLFTNLRSSCITDLHDKGYTEKTMDAIFGNSAKVRSRYYIQFQKEKAYAKVLRDNDRLLQMLREGIDEESIMLDKMDDVLVL